MNLLLSFLVFLFSFQSIDINAMRKDPIVVKFKSATEILMKAGLDGSFKIPKGFDAKAVLAKNPTKEAFALELKKAGMANADKFSGLLYTQSSSVKEFLNKYPQISKLSAVERDKVLKQVFFD